MPRCARTARQSSHTAIPPVWQYKNFKWNIAANRFPLTKTAQLQTPQNGAGMYYNIYVRLVKLKKKHYA